MQPHQFSSTELNPAVSQLKRDMIAETLKRTGGDKSKAARLLDISERSLWYKIKNYGLD